MARLRVGLLGGSFNPAHAGHRHISVLALKRLALDQVWWLVSPQNPLKASADMADFGLRMSAATAAARHPRIRISDIESRLGTRYTIDTLSALKRLHCEHDFVWLMGADNLLQLPAWRRWAEIFQTMPVAVFDRPNYSYRALAGIAAYRFRRERVLEPAALVAEKPPAWCFIRGPTHPASATRIRQQGAWIAS